MPNTNWTETNVVTTSYTEDSIAPTSYTETAPNTTLWARNSGIDTSVPTYDDLTVYYDTLLTYYDGYNANIITQEDVKFAAYTEIAIPANANWTEVN